MSPQAPVGVFDSGLGGISVAREIRARLPAEEILYLADSAYVPYGGRPLEEIRARSLAAGEELVRRGAKAIVVACNTASGAALEALRAEFDLPIVGLEPAVKPAAEITRNGRVGVMATAATLRTERFERLTREHGRGVEIHPQACPGLVELVEEGRMGGAEVEGVLAEQLSRLRQAKIDTVVLGCTHYPFLRSAIARVLGPDVRIIDSGEAVARQVERVLRERNLLSAGSVAGFHLVTTGDADAVRAVAERLWGEEISVEAISV